MEIVTLKEAAGLLNCSHKTIRRLVSEGLFPVPIHTSWGKYERHMWDRNDIEKKKEFVLERQKKAGVFARAPKTEKD